MPARSASTYEVWAVAWTDDAPVLRAEYRRGDARDARMAAEHKAERIAGASTLAGEEGAVSVWVEEKPSGLVLWAAGQKATELQGEGYVIEPDGLVTHGR